MDDLHGKIALVTGSSQGLGREIALALARQGCHILVNCRRHPENAERVGAEIASGGGSAETVQCDISDEDEVRRKFSSRRIDILVNNARLDPYQRPPEMSDGAWFSAMLQVKLAGAYHCICAVRDGMKSRRWGRILNISSVQAHLGMNEKLLAYSVANLGLHALTRTYARILGEYGITVNTLAPGMIRTENLSRRLTEPEIEAKLKSYPIHRAATMKEVVETLLHVIRCGVITGETININSGLYFPA